MSISHRICDMAQINQIKVIYNLGDELDLSDQSGQTGLSYSECKCLQIDITPIVYDY
jgi:hypothetical protein